jgi:hypothetical protein
VRGEWRCVNKKERKGGKKRKRTLIPSEDGKVVRRLRPLNLLGLTSEGLHLHSDLATLDVVVGCADWREGKRVSKKEKREKEEGNDDDARKVLSWEARPRQ